MLRDHLNQGSISAGIVAAYAVLCLVWPSLIPSQARIEHTAPAIATCALGLWGLIDEIRATRAAKRAKRHHHAPHD